jgi:NDP-sugar pyrophosphorylase family protein
LESILIGHSTTISGHHCFSCLSRLQRLQFAPNTIFSGYFLFAECENIQEVIIPDNCVISGDFFFKKASKLERIVIGNNVVIQGSQCFRDCCSIKSITIGDNVTISGLKFLEGCFTNQNVEMIIGSGYVGYPIHIPIPILHIEKFSDIKDKLRYKTKKCAISLEKFKDNSDVIILRCGHIFLLEPLQQWLEIKKFCPSCRQMI